MSSFDLRSRAGRLVISGARGPAGPEGPEGDPGRTVILEASEAIGAKKFVNVYSDSGDVRVRLADATNLSKPAHGFAPEAIANGDTGEIAFFGLNEDTDVADTYGEVWLSETVPGSYQTTAPTTAGRIVQSLGPALEGVGIVFDPSGVAAFTLDTDATLAANRDDFVPSQKAVKTYVGNAVTGLLELKGNTDCSANPNYPAASKGDAYYVTVAGKIGGASGKSVDVGDVYVAKADNAGGTEGSVGTSWFVLEHNLSGVALLSGATFVGDVEVPDEAYDATAWNGSAEVPTKNAVRDKIEALAATVPGAYTDEMARDALGTALAAGEGVAITVDDAGDTITIKLKGATTKQETGTSYTGVLADANKYIQFTNGSAIAFTIPPNSSVAYPVDTVIAIEQNGAGVVTFTAGVGVTLHSRGGLLATAGQYAVAQAKKVATDTWTIIGDVA